MIVRINAAARAELEDAALYYEGEREGHGGAFASAFEAVLDRLESFPRSGTRWARSVGGLETRYVVMRRFPYAVVYTLEEDLAEIVAIGHLRRGPAYWRDRLK